MKQQPDAVLLAPDGCTKYLASAIADDIAYMDDGATLAVHLRHADDRLSLAEWCLSAGHSARSPFPHSPDEQVLIGVREGQVAA